MCFVRAPDGEMRVLDVPEGVNDSAGFESWRRTVWGSDLVRSLGAGFLPVLLDDWMEVEPGELPELLAEIALLREHLDVIAAGTERPRSVEEHRDQLANRLRNIEAAVRRAQELEAGVLIW